MKGGDSVSAREKGGRSDGAVGAVGTAGVGVQGGRRLRLVGCPGLQPLVLGPSAVPSRPPVGSHTRVQVLQKRPPPSQSH